MLRIPLPWRATILLTAWACLAGPAAASPPPPELNAAARQYLAVLERFAGFAEQHWNEEAESYDAAGKGVTWARGNGGVCLANAVLLTALPDIQAFSPRQVPRAALLDHTRRTIRRLCLTSAVCTDPRAMKPGTFEHPGACGVRGASLQRGAEAPASSGAMPATSRQRVSEASPQLRSTASAT